MVIFHSYVSLAEGSITYLGKCWKRGGMSSWSDMGVARNLFPPETPVPPRRQKTPCQTSGGKTLSASLHRSFWGPGTEAENFGQDWSRLVNNPYNGILIMVYHISLLYPLLYHYTIVIPLLYQVHPISWYPTWPKAIQFPNFPPFTAASVSSVKWGVPTKNRLKIRRVFY